MICDFKKNQMKLHCLLVVKRGNINKLNYKTKSSMCHTHGAEFTKLKISYVYYDEMIVLTKSEK